MGEPFSWVGAKKNIKKPPIGNDQNGPKRYWKGHVNVIQNHLKYNFLTNMSSMKITEVNAIESSGERNNFTTSQGAR